MNKGSRVSGFYTDTRSVNDQYEMFMEGSSWQAWLSNWNRRLRITIDHKNVSEALSNFPVLVYLSNSSGRNKEDVSCVFDELQIEDKRKKIAVTTEEAQTQCFVEIEKWDDFNNQAWLWTKISDLSSSQDTVLYLYYDKNHSDNTAYVEDLGSVAAENVWDNNLSAHRFPGCQGGDWRDKFCLSKQRIFNVSCSFLVVSNSTRLQRYDVDVFNTSRGSVSCSQRHRLTRQTIHGQNC